MAALAPPPNIAGVPLPPVPANPASLVDITNAKEYVDRLSFNKHSAVANAATNNEIGQAEAYRTAVVFSYSPGGNVAPPWLVNLTANVQQIANSTQQNTASIANLTANVQQITHSTQQNTASIANLTANVQQITHSTQQNTASIANLTASVQQNTADLANLTANVQQNTADLANLTANVQQIANSTQQNTASIANLTANVQQNTADIANLTAQVGQIANDVVFLRQKTTELPIILANSQAGPRGPLYNPTLMLAQGWAPLLAAPNPRTRDELLVFTAQQCMASSHSLGLPALPHQSTVHERRRQIAIRIGVTIE